MIERGAFNADDLEIVPPPKNPVVLKSGGSIMELLTIEDGIALVELENEEGKLCRYSMPLACLYRCVPAEIPPVQFTVEKDGK